MKEHQNDVYVQEKQNYLKQKKNRVSSFLKKRKKKKKRCIHNKKFFKLKKRFISMVTTPTHIESVWIPFIAEN